MRILECIAVTAALTLPVSSAAQDESQSSARKSTQAWETPLDFAFFMADHAATPDHRIAMLVQISEQLTNSGRTREAREALNRAEAALSVTR